MNPRKLKLAKKREDDIIAKKLLYVELSGGLSSFASPYELREYIDVLDIETVESLLELYAETMPDEFCEAILYVKELLKTRIEVLVPEICLGNIERQTQVE
jgi:hypothetical protein